MSLHKTSKSIWASTSSFNPWFWHWKTKLCSIIICKPSNINWSKSKIDTYCRFPVFCYQLFLFVGENLFVLCITTFRFSSSGISFLFLTYLERVTWHIPNCLAIGLRLCFSAMTNFTARCNILVGVLSRSVLWIYFLGILKSENNKKYKWKSFISVKQLKYTLIQ